MNREDQFSFVLLAALFSGAPPRKSITKGFPAAGGFGFSFLGRATARTSDGGFAADSFFAGGEGRVAFPFGESEEPDAGRDSERSGLAGALPASGIFKRAGFDSAALFADGAPALAIAAFCGFASGRCEEEGAAEISAVLAPSAAAGRRSPPELRLWPCFSPEPPRPRPRLRLPPPEPRPRP